MNKTSWPLFFLVLMEWSGYGMIVPMLPYYGEVLSLSSLEIGVLVSAFAGATLLGAPLVGKLADRVGNKKIICLCLALFSFSMFLASAATSYLVLLTARILSGVAAANTAIVYAYVAEKSEGDAKLSAISFVSAAMALGMVVGPIISSQMVGDVTLEAVSYPFYLVGWLSLMTVVGCYLLLEETKKLSAVKISIKSVGNQILRSRKLRLLYLTKFCITATLSCIIIFFPRWCHSVMDWSIALSGFGVALVGLTIAVVQIALVPKLELFLSQLSLLTLGLSVYLASIVGIFIASTGLGIFLSLFVLGVGYALVSPVISAGISDAVKREEQATALGLAESTKAGGDVTIPALVGWLMDGWGLEVMFIMYGILLLSCLTFSLVQFRRASDGLGSS